MGALEYTQPHDVPLGKQRTFCPGSMERHVVSLWREQPAQLFCTTEHALCASRKHPQLKDTSPTRDEKDRALRGAVWCGELGMPQVARTHVTPATGPETRLLAEGATELPRRAATEPHANGTSGVLDHV